VRSIMVCVGYDDLLSVTLPRNRKHFREVMVVTTPADEATQEVCRRHDAIAFLTDAFTAGGAQFNKWLALEQALDAFGREGWLTIMDADVILPADLGGPESGWPPLALGRLYGALRRMAPWPLGPIPAEAGWKSYPLHRNVNEWAGYLQCFHARDLRLGPPPWHQTDWKHCGGADSFFQQKWHPSNKIRPDWHCLHMGEVGVNWHGRSEEGRRQTNAIWDARRRNRAAGRDPFEGERLR
jgi:hypothetical protein